MKYIDLTQGKKAIVDDEDYEKLSKFKWHAQKHNRQGGASWYAVRHYRDKKIKNKHGQSKITIQAMHRVIMNAPKGKNIDHINGNPLDNRKKNLRICTHQQNLWNSRYNKTPDHPYKGVLKFHSKGHPGWQVFIGYNGQTIRLGWFKSAIVAAKTYDKLAKALFGDFACLNFP